MPENNLNDPTTDQEIAFARPLNPGRDQILARLWEIANLDPERTRASASAQVKALSLIVAIEGLIPDRRAVSAQNPSAPPPVKAQIYTSAWLAKQHGESQPPPAEEVAAPDLSSAVPLPPTPDPAPDLIESNFPGALNPSQTPSSPRPHMSFVPDARLAFSIKKNPFARRR
jgi:hypothetical protein